MTCRKCGHDWFVEEKLVRLAAEPTDDRIRPLALATRYRYRCALCAVVWIGENEDA